MNKKQTMGQSVQHFTVNTGIESSFWMTNVISQKLKPKLLVYIVISPRGVSVPFIQPSGYAVNQFIYRDNCLASSLLPFIKKYHPDGNYIF